MSGRRILIVGYGVVAYVLFLVTFTYTIGFLAGVGVPKDVDDGVVGPVATAVLVNLALLTLFAVQHSVMARPWFKRRWTRVVAPSIERSTYVLLASLVVALLLWQWRPLPGTVWSVEAGWARVALWSLYALGWGILLLSTFLLGHFELFGIRQVLTWVRDRADADLGFRQPLLYRFVRHPLMVGFLIAFWAAPDMSAGRLLFVAVATAYIMVAVRWEERDLRTHLGAPYERYMAQVPRFVPGVAGLTRRREAPPLLLSDDRNP